jgi:hypothetical protein
VVSFGGEWADLLQNSLSRQLAGIVHLNVYGKDFQITEPLIRASFGAWWESLKDSERSAFIRRLNSLSTQASELVWKLTQLVRVADIIFLDTKMLDTAIGQFVLMGSGDTPVWAVGVDAKTSPLAPVYLRGILYPSTPDDLVKVILEGNVPRAVRR